jgi:hypothetical protein
MIFKVRNDFPSPVLIQYYSTPLLALLQKLMIEPIHMCTLSHTHKTHESCPLAIIYNSRREYATAALPSRKCGRKVT